MVDIVVIPESRSQSVQNKDTLKKSSLFWERDNYVVGTRYYVVEHGNYIFYIVMLIMVLICYNLEL